MEIGFMQGRLCDRVDGKIQAFPWFNWEKEFPVAQQLGIPLMEWTLDQERLYENPLMTASGRQRIRELSSRHGVRVLSLTGDCFMQAPFFKASGAVREGLLRDLHAIVDACVDLGLRYLLIPLVDNGSLTSADEESALLEGLLPLIAQIAAWRARYPLLLPEHADDSQGVSMYHFTDRLSELLQEGDVIAPGSSGFAAELFLLNLRIKKGQRCFHNRGTGSMGFGIPSAVGACLASGRRQTLCVEGDGGLQMNIQELATLVALKLPVKCFVINNQGYASIRVSQNAHFKLLVGADSSSGLHLPDLRPLCAAYGIGYARIDSHQGLDESLLEVLGREGPVLCEVMVQVEEPRIPRVMTRINEQGKPESGALEDLYPFLPREELAEHWPLSSSRDADDSMHSPRG